MVTPSIDGKLDNSSVISKHRSLLTTISAALAGVLMLQYFTFAVAARMDSKGLVIESVVIPSIADEVISLLLRTEIPVAVGCIGGWQRLALVGSDKSGAGRHWPLVVMVTTLPL